VNIPDEVLQAADEAGRVVDIRSARVIAEWARKESLDEVLRVAEENRVIMVTRHAGYTVENYADPLVKIAVLRALADGDRS
jgi:3-deoxy-D-manno-octulosonic acid (KDO) 8-phosphate synthase